MILINSKSSTVLTIDIYPSPIFAGEAFALQLAKGRTELVPIATMRYVSLLILPNLPAPTATMQDQVRTKKDFSSLCTCKLLLHQLSQKRASSFTTPVPGSPRTTPPALQRKEGARRAGAARRSTATPADFSGLENICKPPRQHPSPQGQLRAEGILHRSHSSINRFVALTGIKWVII